MRRLTPFGIAAFSLSLLLSTVASAGPGDNDPIGLEMRASFYWTVPLGDVDKSPSEAWFGVKLHAEVAPEVTPRDLEFVKNIDVLDLHFEQDSAKQWAVFGKTAEPENRVWE